MMMTCHRDRASRVDRHTHTVVTPARARGRGRRDGVGGVASSCAARTQGATGWEVGGRIHGDPSLELPHGCDLRPHDDAHDDLVPSSPPAGVTVLLLLRQRAHSERDAGVLTSSSSSSFDGASSSPSSSWPSSSSTHWPQLNYMMQDLDMPRDARIRCRQYFHQSKRIHRLHTYTTLEARPVRWRCTLALGYHRWMARRRQCVLPVGVALRRCVARRYAAFIPCLGARGAAPARRSRE